MKLFKKNKNEQREIKLNDEIKTTCACGGSCGISDVTKSRIIVLGACCKKSKDTFENVKKAALDLGITENVTNIGDSIEIAKYGVMQTPALVIDSKVVSYGKYISVEDGKKLLESLK